MALHINLYHEIQRQEEERRRDPFKLAGLAIVLIALGFAIYYFYRANEVHAVESRVADLQSSLNKVQPQSDAAKAREAELIIQQKANQALVDRLQNRFYWGPFLEQIAATVPRNVQITSLSGELVERKGPVNVLLSGIAAGRQPRPAAEAFRLALIQKLGATFYSVSATFDANSLEDSSEVVPLDGQSLPTATFKIRLRFFLDATAGATPTPTPTLHLKKSRHEAE